MAKQKGEAKLEIPITLESRMDAFFPVFCEKFIVGYSGCIYELTTDLIKDVPTIRIKCKTSFILKSMSSEIIYEFGAVDTALILNLCLYQHLSWLLYSVDNDELSKKCSGYHSKIYSRILESADALRILEFID